MQHKEYWLDGQSQKVLPWFVINWYIFGKHLASDHMLQFPHFKSEETG